MRRRAFPRWVSGASWVFIAVTLAPISAALTLDKLGLHPDPLGALLATGLPAFVALLFLADDWRTNRRRPW